MHAFRLFLWFVHCALPEASVPAGTRLQPLRHWNILRRCRGIAIAAPTAEFDDMAAATITAQEAYERFEAGAIGTGSHAVWLQVARLGAAAIVPEVRRWLRISRGIAYAVYAWMIFAVLAPSTWLITAVIPRPDWAWSVSHRMARLFFALTRAPH
jgi:hypothetical protein